MISSIYALRLQGWKTKRLRTSLSHEWYGQTELMLYIVLNEKQNAKIELLGENWGLESFPGGIKQFQFSDCCVAKFPSFTPHIISKKYWHYKWLFSIKVIVYQLQVYSQILKRLCESEHKLVTHRLFCSLLLIVMRRELLPRRFTVW